MRSALLFLAALLGVSPSFAADIYPNKPVTVIVPVAAGGSSDKVARVLCAQLTKQMGQPCLVENRPGGSEIIGTEMVAKAAPDGYTLLLADPSFSIIPNWFKALPFSIPKDFQPVTQVISAQWALVVRPSLGVNSLKELIALAQKNPGKLNYGSAGVGGAPFMWSEQFKLAAKVNITHIPYKGASEVVNALLGGEVDMLTSTLPTVIGQVQAGKLKALAVSGDKRAVSMPDVPTMSEAGISGANNAFMGLIGPAGMPKDVLDKLHAEVAQAVKDPTVKERYAADSAEPVANTPDEFSKVIRISVQQWADVIKLGGINPTN